MVAQSTLTDRYQTTVPAPIRQALGLSKQDKIAYHLSADGTVQLSRVQKEDEIDPVLEKFLAFLAEDIENNPQNVKPLTVEWADRAKELVAGVDIGDINQPLSPEDE